MTRGFQIITLALVRILCALVVRQRDHGHQLTVVNNVGFVGERLLRLHHPIGIAIALGRIGRHRVMTLS